MNRGSTSLALAVLLALAAACAPTPPARVPHTGAITERSLIKQIGDRHVYLILNGERHFISDRKTILALGFKLADIIDVTPSQAANFPMGFPFETDRTVAQLTPQAMSTIPDRTLIRVGTEGRVFVILLGQRHWIRQKTTVVALGIDADHISEVSQQTLEDIPEGPAW